MVQRSRAVLTILSAGSDSPKWQRIVEAYYEQSLPGLQDVPSSANAVVQQAYVAAIGNRLYFKLFRVRGFFDFIKHLGGRIRAERAAEGGKLLARHGFASVPVCCAAVVRRWGVPVESLLITEDAGNVPTIAELAAELPLEKAGRRVILEAFAEEVARLHRASIYHGDLQGKNVICKCSPSEIVFLFLDNERTVCLPDLSFSKRVKNLRQLDKLADSISGSERRLFWRVYRRAAGMSAQEARLVLQALTSKRVRRRIGPCKIPDRLSILSLADRLSGARR